jgi:uncharacterized protein involved in propanediol utilization
MEHLMHVPDRHPLLSRLIASDIHRLFNIARKLFRKAVRQGRSKRRGEAYSLSYVELLSAARTPLADFINSLRVASRGDNGTGIGASHQTGWMGLVAKLIQRSGEYVA